MFLTGLSVCLLVLHVMLPRYLLPPPPTCTSFRRRLLLLPPTTSTFLVTQACLCSFAILFFFVSLHVVRLNDNKTSSFLLFKVTSLITLCGDCEVVKELERGRETGKVHPFSLLGRTCIEIWGDGFVIHDEHQRRIKKGHTSSSVASSSSLPNPSVMSSIQNSESRSPVYVCYAFSMKETRKTLEKKVLSILLLSRVSLPAAGLLL